MQLTTEEISQCQNDLEKQGYCLIHLQLNQKIKQTVKSKNYEKLDSLIQDEISGDGDLIKLLKNFCPVKNIEFIISLRDAANEWEEDGIWHDDGSRILAFSLSLTLEKPLGGVLEIRKKGAEISAKIPTPEYGTIMIFQTGATGWEHKINQVTRGQRLIIAGWCYP